MGYVMNRPEEAAMQRLLARNPNNTLGVILRLAWLAGLTREEIVQLTWADISRDTKTLLLKDRRVPLCEDLMRCLEERVALYGNLSLYVAISEKYHDAMNPGSVSRMVRQALDSEGQTSVRLTDLRHDFIIRQLQVNDWAYVVQLSGLAVETFQILYSDYIAVRTPTKNKVEYDDEYRIWQILQKEKDSAIGLALWMRWYMDLQLTELVELTWDQVDFERNRVHLKTRDVELVQSVRTRLLEELGRRAEGDDPHVLLTGHSRTPVNLSNFSKLLRTTLIRGGVENLSFRDVRQTPAADGEKRAILALAKSRKGLVRSDVMEHMGLSAYAAKRRLDELVDERALVKVYATYYPAEQVVPLEEQESCIRAYLQEHGKATWDDMHLLLGLERRQCARILNRMVKEGVLLKQSDAFYLAETTEESKVS